MAATIAGVGAVGAFVLMGVAVADDPRPLEPAAEVVEKTHSRTEAGDVWQFRVCALDAHGRATDRCTWVDLDHDRWDQWHVGARFPIPPELLATPTTGPTEGDKR